MSSKYHHQSCGENFEAKAPYNFVPLPERVFPAPEVEVSQDRYHNDKYTGYFVLNITTETPLYVRCAYPPNVPLGADGKPEVTKTRQCQEFFHHGDSEIPVIPGSSLRGMARALVEILSFAKMSKQMVSDKLLIHRAVGDVTTLGKKYRGQMLKELKSTSGIMLFDYPTPNLLGGWLEKDGNQYFIRPALKAEGESFIHVEYSDFEKVYPRAPMHNFYEVYVKPYPRTTPPRSKTNLKLNLAITDCVRKAEENGLKKAFVVVSGHMSAGNVNLKFNELRDARALAKKLKAQRDDVSKYLFSKLSAKTQNSLNQYDGSSDPDKYLKQALIEGLNDIINGGSLANEAAFKSLPLSLDGQRLTRRIMTKEVQSRLNRRLLEAAFPKEIKPRDVTEKHMHCAIYEKDNNAERILIPDSLWRIYEDDCKLPRGEKTGTRELKPGHPLFYLTEKNDKGENKLVFFGPTMMFRLPYPNNLYDFIPEELKRDDQVDLAESIFGFVNQNSKETRAGRVFFTDAVWNKKENENPFFDGAYEGRRVPRILSSPKPTSFQLYLNQPSVKTTKDGANQDGDTLKSYYDKDQTIIRGTKGYWHQRSLTNDKEKFVEFDNKAIIKDYKVFEFDKNGKEIPAKQHTAIRPVRRGTEFTGRVYFENLSKTEVGALLTALDLPAPKRHKLGMGKPLGLGTIQIKTSLVLQDRLPREDKQARYDKLFASDKNWQGGNKSQNEAEQIAQDCKDEFRRAILSHYKSVMSSFTVDVAKGQLETIPRLHALFTMLEWENAIQDESKLEYLPPDCSATKKRYVLPSAQAVERSNLLQQPNPTLTPPARKQTENVAALGGSSSETMEYTFIELAINKLKQKSDVKDVPAIVGRIDSLKNEQMQRKLATQLRGWLQEKKLWNKEPHSSAEWRQRINTMAGEGGE